MKRPDNPRSDSRYLYRAYGLDIASDIELPELIEADRNVPDVEVIERCFPQDLENAEYRWSWAQFGQDRCQFTVDGIARYRVETGNKIFVNRLDSKGPEEDGAIDGVRLCLLGSAFGALLHQRRWLPLHVSSVVTRHGVWAFSGPSGAGKSTLAAWMSDRLGWPLISDDVGVVDPANSRPILHPGPPRLKLWRSSLNKLGIEDHGLIRDLARFDKYHLPQQQAFDPSPQPLSVLVVMDRTDGHEAPTLERLTGADAFKAVLTSIYRPDFCDQMRNPLELMGEISQLLSKITVLRFRREWSLDALDEGLGFLSEKMESGLSDERQTASS